MNANEEKFRSIFYLFYDNIYPIHKYMVQQSEMVCAFGISRHEKINKLYNRQQRIMKIKYVLCKLNGKRFHRKQCANNTHEKRKMMKTLPILHAYQIHFFLVKIFCFFPALKQRKIAHNQFNVTCC